jgi:hypothetical protein
MRRTIAIVAFVLAACAEPSDGDESESSTTDTEPRGPAELVDPFLWVRDDAADPMPAHRPADAECEIGFGEEFGVFEVDTQICDYGIFSQPMLADVRVGDTVELTITHDDLIADEPAIGHVLVTLGDAHTFEAEVEIPHTYGLVNVNWIADVDVDAGVPVVFHLHNHGFNQWRLVAIMTRPPME